MVEFIHGQASARKLRLFACGCCRSVWHLLRDEESQSAVEVAESFADGGCGEQELAAAHRLADQVATQAWSLWDDGSAQAMEAAVHSASLDPVTAAVQVSEYVSAAMQAEAGGEFGAWKTAQRHQCDLLRCCFANPYTLRESPDPVLFQRNEGAVLVIARSIYEQRQFNELPILADALEDAGYNDGLILDHLRSAGPHIRGCFALDAVLSLS